MYANGVEPFFPLRYFDHCMKKSSVFKAIGGDIDIFPACDWEFAEHGVAVMTGAVDRVLSVGKVRPKLLGQKFKLALVWPFFDLFFVTFMLSLDLLEENQVRMNPSNGLTDCFEAKATPSGAKALMDIVGKDSEGVLQFFHPSGRVADFD